METPLRRTVVVVTLVALTALAGCGTQEQPRSRALPTAAPTPGPDPARDAYEAAMCPIFAALLDLDERLESLRAAGQAGDVASVEGDLEPVAASILGVLEGLDAVPTWQPGGELRFRLTSNLHTIRAAIISVIRDPAARTSVGTLAALPLISSDALDASMQQAVEAGLDCQGIG